MRVEVSPAAKEAERRLVTVCCEHPRSIELADASPADFGEIRWRAAWAAMQELASQDRAIHDVALMEAVSATVGGSLGLADLVNLDGLPDLVPDYCRIIRKEAARRRVQLGLSHVLEQSHDLDPEQMVERMAQIATEASGYSQERGGHSIRELAKERLSEYESLAKERENGATDTHGIPTGIEQLDYFLGGLQRGIVTLVAARPGVGKSTLALNLTRNISAEHGVHVFSLEEPREHYMDRVFSLTSKISSDQLRYGLLNQGQMQQLGQALRQIGRCERWIVDDRSGVRAEDIVRNVRLRAQANHTQVVVVDYINILKRQYGEDKRTMLDNAINTFADAAKRDRMAYVVLAQLNRQSEHRDDPTPKLSDLKESGTLEERAKAVLLLHRSDKLGPNRARVIIAKNSQGQTGPVELDWYPERMYIGGR